MARSLRKRPHCGIAGTSSTSEKKWKQASSRVLRHAEKRVIRASDEPDPVDLPDKRQLVNQYSGPKDGKMRFDAARYPKLGRK